MTPPLSVLNDQPFEITYGHSKDKRPDLKQFLISMLCVDRNIPIVGSCKDGNASDKALNNDLLNTISKHMAKNGLGNGAFVYVADAAFVTPNNLKTSAINEVKFLTRLPATYKECSRAIEQAVATDKWVEIGTVNKTPATAKRPAAYYRCCQTSVDLYDETYRAIVVHSSAHDKRRHKRIDRLLARKLKVLKSTCKKLNPGTFFCRADAQKAAETLGQEAVGSYHNIECQIIKVAKYPRGRPSKDKPRTPIGHEYNLEVTIEENETALTGLGLRAGCFVLISNLTEEKDYEIWDCASLLKLYKDQSGIEQNFGFLKDPVIVNSIFLKTNSRIEVLGLVLVISLLIWRLMERCMRQYVETNGKTITGWEKRQTNKPTCFMMTTKFLSILVLKSGNQRQLSKPLNPIQLEFLQALGINPDVFTTP